MNEITHMVNPNAINVDWPLHDNKKYILEKHLKDQLSLVSTLIQPSELESHRQVPLTDAKIAPSTKIALQNLL